MDGEVPRLRCVECDDSSIASCSVIASKTLREDSFQKRSRVVAV